MDFNDGDVILLLNFFMDGFLGFGFGIVEGFGVVGCVNDDYGCFY